MRPIVIQAGGSRYRKLLDRLAGERPGVLLVPGVEGAERLAADLEQDVYRIDLAEIISKYIGETEKNLDRLFGSEKARDALFYFEGADAFYGRRSRPSGEDEAGPGTLELETLLSRVADAGGIALFACGDPKALSRELRHRALALVG